MGSSTFNTFPIQTNLIKKWNLISTNKNLLINADAISELTLQWQMDIELKGVCWSVLVGGDSKLIVSEQFVTKWFTRNENMLQENIFFYSFFLLDAKELRLSPTPNTNRINILGLVVIVLISFY